MENSSTSKSRIKSYKLLNFSLLQIALPPTNLRKKYVNLNRSQLISPLHAIPQFYFRLLVYYSYLIAIFRHKNKITCLLLDNLSPQKNRFKRSNLWCLYGSSRLICLLFLMFAESRRHDGAAAIGTTCGRAMCIGRDAHS